MFTRLFLIIWSLVQVGGHSAYLHVPDGAMENPAPAALVFHDHGAHYTIGKEKMISPQYRPDLSPEANDQFSADARKWVKNLYSGIYLADSLAAMGYVVLVTDVPGWGERGFWVESLTEPWSDAILHADSQALDYILSMPFVDKSSVTTVGFSMGAYRAWMLAAGDKRVTRVAAFHWMTPVVQKGKWCQQADYPLKAAQIAPRPFLLVAGCRDHLFPIEQVRQAVDTIRAHAPRSYPLLRYAEVDADHVFVLQSYELLKNFLSYEK